MHKKYKLPFKTRLLLLLLKPYKPKRFHKMNLKQIRRVRKEQFRFPWVNWVVGKPRGLASISDREIQVRDGSRIRVRIYTPPGEGPKPLIVNYHGGGWVVGSLQLAEFYCAELARQVGAVVVSVDYRLAPEFQFPTAVYDAYDAMVWAVKNAKDLNIDAEKVGVTGDSAGGNLAAVVALKARDLKGPKISSQVLIYPATNSRRDYPSMREFGNAPMLCVEEIDDFLEKYIPDKSQRTLPYFSPWHAKSHQGLPPAKIITAGQDPLRDDGKTYLEKLKSAGVRAELTEYPNDIHAFVSFPNHTESGRKAINEAADWFRETLV